MPDNKMAGESFGEALEKTAAIQEETEFTQEGEKAPDTLLKIAKELDEKSRVDLLMYSPQSLEDCVEFIDKRLETSEIRETWWTLKGAILRALERYRDAICCQDKALEINPREAFAWTEKGLAIWWPFIKQFKKHDDRLLKGLCTKEELEEFDQKQDQINKEARECFDKALKINPQYEGAWFWKSFTVTVDEGKRCIDKALEINPKFAEAWLQKAVFIHSYALTSDEYKSKLWEAVECCDTALRIAPSYTQALKEKEEMLAEIRRLS